MEQDDISVESLGLNGSLNCILAIPSCSSWGSIGIGVRMCEEHTTIEFILAMLIFERTGSINIVLLLFVNFKLMTDTRTTEGYFQQIRKKYFGWFNRYERKGKHAKKWKDFWMKAHTNTNTRELEIIRRSQMTFTIRRE